MAYLDNNGVIYLWNKIKTVLFNKSITNLSASGRTITYTKGDGTTGTVTTQDTNTIYGDFKGATSAATGTRGLVPAPASGKQGAILSGAGEWQVPTFSSSKKEHGIDINLNIAGVDYCAGIGTADGASVGLMPPDLFTKLLELPSNDTLGNTYAKKSEITNMYKYRGSVASSDKLPTTGQRVGDVYNIEAASKYGGAGMNVAWNGTAWDPLGEIFTIPTITNAQIDAICV